LTDVLRDLERVASVNFNRANELWTRYRPEDRDKPAFLDNDEFAEQRRRGRESGKPDREEDRVFVAPDLVRKRFIQADNRYYFKDGENRLAFEDQGNRLSTQSDDPTVALALVQLAEAKGWQKIAVRGTEEFRRSVWLDASVKGLEVSGYKPRDVDLAKLSELQKEVGPASVRQGRNVVSEAVAESSPPLKQSEQALVEAITSTARRSGVAEATVTRIADRAALRQQSLRPVVGRLEEFGYAPYENKPDNQPSYFVRVATATGESKTVWGVDLARAVRDAGTQRGDEIVVTNRGRQPVSREVRESDEAGNGSVTRRVEAYRNQWNVQRLDAVREDARPVLRELSDRQPPALQVLDRSAPRTVARQDIGSQRTPDLERGR
jgi:putative DNA primase/helicase